jgi:hypothetical protein
MSAWYCIFEDKTYIIIFKHDPITKQTYLGSCHGRFKLFQGGGVLGGRRAFIKKQEGTMRTAFIPAMINNVFRNPAFSTLYSDTDRGRTDLIKQPPQCDRINNSPKSTPTYHDTNCRTPFPEEPMSTNSRSWRVDE